MIDESDDTIPKPPMFAPWSAGYAIDGAKAPKLVVQEAWKDNSRGFEIIAATAIGPVTFKLLDHHRVPFASQTKGIGAGRTKFWFSEKQLGKAEMVELVHGTFHDFAQRQTGGESSFSFWFITRAEYDTIINAFPEDN